MAGFMECGGKVFAVTSLHDGTSKMPSRMLKQIQVRCPIDKDCSWLGDYESAVAHVKDDAFHSNMAALKITAEPSKLKVPTFIDCSGAGIPEVNGSYCVAGMYGGCLLFDMPSLWKKKSVVFSIHWIDTAGAWFLSVLPSVSSIPDPSLCLYHSSDEHPTIQGIPPESLWHLARKGKYPCPTIRLITFQ